MVEPRVCDLTSNFSACLTHTPWPFPALCFSLHWPSWNPSIVSNFQTHFLFYKEVENHWEESSQCYPARNLFISSHSTYSLSYILYVFFIPSQVQVYIPSIFWSPPFIPYFSWLAYVSPSKEYLSIPNFSPFSKTIWNAMTGNQLQIIVLPPSCCVIMFNSFTSLFSHLDTKNHNNKTAAFPLRHSNETSSENFPQSSCKIL